MDPATLVILLAMAGAVSSLVAFRRAGGASRALRASDPLSAIVGLVLMAGAVAVAAMLLLGR